MTTGHSIQGPVFVAGPPGAGKSSLSRVAAERLALSPLDTDDEVERRSGLNPAALISHRGEAALRSEERRIVSELDGDPRIVALGGGAFVDADTRAAVRRLGPVIGLEGNRETFWSRVAREPGQRPLCPDRVSFDRLLDERDSAYARTDIAVRSDGPEPETALVDAIAELGFVSVRLGDETTRVVVGRGLARAAGAATAELAPSRPILVVEDAKVPSPLRHSYTEALERWGPVIRREVPGGEDVKSWSLLGSILEEAVAGGCGRQSVVVGVGGGAVCDLSAMVAGLLGRGAPLVLVPTTLLGQVDAAIGGKAAVNLQGGKNLAGLFAPAREVVVDLDFLASLDGDRLREGLAETYKAALLSSRRDRDELMGSREPTVASVLRAIEAKARIVSADPKELGVRRLLNLGHTWGHAVESASGHQIPHGHAVAIGLAFIARWSADRGLTEPHVRDLVLSDLDALGLPTKAPREVVEPAIALLRADKKGSATHAQLVALRDFGRIETIRYSWETLETELLRLEA